MKTQYGYYRTAVTHYVGAFFVLKRKKNTFWKAVNALKSRSMKERLLRLTAKDSPRKPLKKLISIGPWDLSFQFLCRRKTWAPWGKTRRSKFGLEINCTYSAGARYGTQDALVQSEGGTATLPASLKNVKLYNVWFNKRQEIYLTIQ